jgi:hypothetical protein
LALSNISDVSLWVFVACTIGFLAAVGLTIKSYRDAKYGSYFFLREEAALRVKRLLLVLIPLAIVIVFLGLRLFGPGGISPLLAITPAGGTPSRVGSASATPKSTQPISTTATLKASVPATGGPPTVLPGASRPVTSTKAAGPTAPAPVTATVTAALPATTAPVSPTTTSGSGSPASPTTAPAATRPVTPSAAAGPIASAPTFPATRLPGPGGTPPAFDAETATSAAPMTMTVTAVSSATAPVSGTATLSDTAPAASPTVTDTPVQGQATPRPDAFLGSLVLSRGIGPNKTPLQPSSTFSVNDAYIYVFYEFRNMTNGIAWSHRWFRGSAEVGSESNLWNYGLEGRGYLFFSPAVGPGQYEIRLYIGDKIMASAPFEIQ